MSDGHASPRRPAKKQGPKVQLCWHCLNPVTNHIRGCVMAQGEKR